MDLSVRAQKISGVNRPFAAHIRRLAARFFDNHSQRSQVPRLRRPIQRRFGGSFCDEHVLPESSKSAPAASGIRHAADLLLSQFVLARPRPRGEHHRFAQPRDVRDVNPLPIPLSAFPALGPPPPPHSHPACHTPPHFSLPLTP